MKTPHSYSILQGLELLYILMTITVFLFLFSNLYQNDGATGGKGYGSLLRACVRVRVRVCVCVCV